MRSYEFLAGDKEKMFDSIGSVVPSSKSEVAKDIVSENTKQSTERLPIPVTDNAVEQSFKQDQPQPYFNPYEIPMTQEDWESEYGAIEHPEIAQLRSDEGYRNDVYKDSLGNLTVGTGHLLTDDMLEKYKEGDTIPDEELEELFNKDFEVARSDAEKFAPSDSPEVVKNIVTNMAFQLGLPKLNKFKGFKAALASKDYNKAADEMLDSLWAEQTPERANRLADRMRALADDGEQI